jgi:hypothetical protein
VSAITWTLTVTSAILTGSLLTKATGRHDRFYYAGSPGAGSADVEARSGPKLALEPQQRADCDENKLRLVRAPGESYSDVILRLASDAKP